jgi:hypothetical protein
MGLAFVDSGRMLASGSTDGTLKMWGVGDGKLRATFQVLESQADGKNPGVPAWIAYTPEGYYDASPGAAKFIRWRVGGELLPAGSLETEMHRPDLVQQVLQDR